MICSISHFRNWVLSCNYPGTRTGFLGQPLSCKLKVAGPLSWVVVRLSVHHGCIVAKRCKILGPVQSLLFCFHRSVGLMPLFQMSDYQCLQVSVIMSQAGICDYWESWPLLYIYIYLQAILSIWCKETVGSDVVGVEFCQKNGFSSNLLCSSCRELEQFSLQPLIEPCNQCCQQDTDTSQAKQVSFFILILISLRSAIVPWLDDHVTVFSCSTNAFCCKLSLPHWTDLTDFWPSTNQFDFLFELVMIKTLHYQVTNFSDVYD